MRSIVSFINTVDDKNVDYEFYELKCEIELLVSDRFSVFGTRRQRVVWVGVDDRRSMTELN